MAYSCDVWGETITILQSEYPSIKNKIKDCKILKNRSWINIFSKERNKYTANRYRKRYSTSLIITNANQNHKWDITHTCQTGHVHSVVSTLCDQWAMGLPASAITRVFQERILGLPFPSQGSKSPTLQADSLASEQPGSHYLPDWLLSKRQITVLARI